MSAQHTWYSKYTRWSKALAGLRGLVQITFFNDLKSPEFQQVVKQKAEALTDDFWNTMMPQLRETILDSRYSYDFLIGRGLQESVRQICLPLFVEAYQLQAGLEAGQERFSMYWPAHQSQFDGERMKDVTGDPTTQPVAFTAFPGIQRETYQGRDLESPVIVSPARSVSMLSKPLNASLSDQGPSDIETDSTTDSQSTHNVPQSRHDVCACVVQHMRKRSFSPRHRLVPHGESTLERRTQARPSWCKRLGHRVAKMFPCRRRKTPKPGKRSGAMTDIAGMSTPSRRKEAWRPWFPSFRSKRVSSSESQASSASVTANPDIERHPGTDLSTTRSVPNSKGPQARQESDSDTGLSSSVTSADSRPQALPPINSIPMTSTTSNGHSDMRMTKPPLQEDLAPTDRGRPRLKDSRALETIREGSSDEDRSPASSSPANKPNQKPSSKRKRSLFDHADSRKRPRTTHEDTSSAEASQQSTDVVMTDAEADYSGIEPRTTSRKKRTGKAVHRTGMKTRVTTRSALQAEPRVEGGSNATATLDGGMNLDIEADPITEAEEVSPNREQRRDLKGQSSGERDEEEAIRASTQSARKHRSVRNSDTPRHRMATRNRSGSSRPEQRST